MKKVVVKALSHKESRWNGGTSNRNYDNAVHGIFVDGTQVAYSVGGKGAPWKVWDMDRNALRTRKAFWSLADVRAWAKQNW